MPQKASGKGIKIWMTMGKLVKVLPGDLSAVHSIGRFPLEAKRVGVDTPLDHRLGGALGPVRLCSEGDLFAPRGRPALIGRSQPANTLSKTFRAELLRPT